MERYGLKVVEVGCVYWEVVLVMFFLGLSCFSLLRAMSAFFFRRQVRVIGKSRPLWPRKWIAFIDSVVVLGSGAVWPEVIRMHAGVARSAADSKRRAVLLTSEQQHLL
jgi:hypothetical protein